MSSKYIFAPSMTSKIWHHENCFGCGEHNPFSLSAEFPFNEEFGEVRFNYTARNEHEGAPGYVHGGILASLLDESQGVLCFHLGHFVMTDQLYMRYYKASTLLEPLHIRAWITMVRKKRLYTKATIHGPNGDLLVSSKARWYDMPERVIRKMFTGRYSNEKIDLILGTMEANRRRAKKIRQAIRLAKKSL